MLILKIILYSSLRNSFPSKERSTTSPALSRSTRPVYDFLRKAKFTPPLTCHGASDFPNEMSFTLLPPLSWSIWLSKRSEFPIPSPPHFDAHDFQRKGKSTPSLTLPRSIQRSTRSEFHSTFLLSKSIQELCPDFKLCYVVYIITKMHTRVARHNFWMQLYFSRETGFTSLLSSAKECFPCEAKFNLSLTTSKKGYRIIFRGKVPIMRYKTHFG